jgi:hypothetical protein
MAFGPNSTNPRERRAYAHVKIAAAKESGELRDLWVAQMAVNQTGDFKKAANSGFKGAIEGAAMADEATRVIVEKGREVADPSLTPRIVTSNGVYAGRRSRVFSAFATGAYMGIQPGPVEGTLSLMLADHDKVGYPAPQTIPSDSEGNPDVWQIRHISDEARTAIASVAATIEVPRPRGERITNLYPGAEMRLPPEGQLYTSP